MTLENWFDKAIPSEDYVNAMETHKDNLNHIYNNFSVPEDTEFFQNVKEKKLRAIVLTEDWCGDAMMNIPILLKIAEHAAIDVRMLLRDQNLELMDQYLTNGTSRSIPIFIFIDQAGNEVAKWGPRAETVQQFVDEIRADLPAKEAEDYQEKFQEMITTMTKTFTTNTALWDQVYTSIKQTLLKS
ncbi:thioredoxin family protein [Ornithinibacillus contaminans]|uniref:thioredoxin family protein n=1 Tax=Ornithinibacillus contaminans TaxID=694055 RepID=UPI00064DF019|nr:thioredoxin family protein [Ornithinibacillus contaminans]